MSGINFTVFEMQAQFSYKNEKTFFIHPSLAFSFSNNLDIIIAFVHYIMHEKDFRQLYTIANT